jgi:hypothetical protein
LFDHVHYQHSERLVDKLIEHGRKSGFLAYPNRTQAPAAGMGTRAHLRLRQRQ